MNVIEKDVRENIRPSSASIRGYANESPARQLPALQSADSQSAGFSNSQLFQSASRQSSGWSESIQTVLEQPPTAFPRYLLFLGIAFTGIFGIWAYTGQMQEVANAAGQLVPQGETYKIQLPIAGEIDRILVQEGDLVKKGQLLLALDAELLQEELARLEQTLSAHQHELLQIQSLIEQTRRESMAQAQIAAANVQAQRSSMLQSQANTASNEQLLNSLGNMLHAQEERLDRISFLEEQGAISREYLFNLEQGVREQQQSIEQTQGEINQSLAQTQQIEAELARRNAEAQKMEIEMQQSLQRLMIETEQRQADIADTQHLIEKAKFKLSQSNVRSPIEGIVSTLEIDNIGEVVSVGNTLAEVMPAETPLVLSTLLPQQEAGLVDVGMEAKVKLEAFPYQDYGILSGTVISISPDTKGGPEAGNSYQVEIALDKDHVMHENQPVALRAGEVASAEIVVRRRKIIDLILDPVRRLSADDLSL